jgi:hypothetical protein
MINKYKLVRVKDPDFDDYFTWDIEDLSSLDEDGFPDVVATLYDQATAKKVLKFLNGGKK